MDRAISNAITPIVADVLLEKSSVTDGMPRCRPRLKDPGRVQVTRDRREEEVRMRKREFAMLVGPSVVVMFGLLLLPLVRTVQWSLQEVDYGEPGRSSGWTTTPRPSATRASAGPSSSRSS